MMRHRLLSPAVWVLAAVTACACGRADSTHAPPKSRTLDLPGYLAALDNCSAAAARLKQHPAEAAALKSSLPRSWPVTIGGQKFDVPGDWLQQELDAFPSDPAQAAQRSRQILSRLQVMRDSAAALTETDRGDAGGADRAAARQQLDRILQRREFRRTVAPGPLQTWWDRAVRWIEDKIVDFFGRLGRHSRLPSPAFWALGIGLGLALLGWLIHSVLEVSRRPARSVPHTAVAVAGWQEWATRALACARLGEFREAIHMAYRVALYRLEETGLWQVDEARTPREYLRLVPGGHRQYPPLEALTFRFERSWYGGQAASADDFRHAVVELKDLGCLLDWNPATASS